jgi:uncharacterized membrane protein SpoIIM required for sporulation
MKILYKSIIVLILAILLVSCKTANTVVVMDNNVYYDYDAVIANDLYNELYNNGVIKNKPIVIK